MPKNCPPATIPVRGPARSKPPDSPPNIRLHFPRYRFAAGGLFCPTDALASFQRAEENPAAVHCQFSVSGFHCPFPAPPAHIPLAALLRRRVMILSSFSRISLVIPCNSSFTAYFILFKNVALFLHLFSLPLVHGDMAPPYISLPVVVTFLRQGAIRQYLFLRFCTIGGRGGYYQTQQSPLWGCGMVWGHRGNSQKPGFAASKTVQPSGCRTVREGCRHF